MKESIEGYLENEWGKEREVQQNWADFGPSGRNGQMLLTIIITYLLMALSNEQSVFLFIIPFDSYRRPYFTEDCWSAR